MVAKVIGETLLNQAIDNDLKIFDDNADDSVLEQGFREIASNAAAVGVPIAAIYLSGSVVGLSAAGITSGLTALGFGGLFGFASSMVTGIGAVILLGVGAKKGVEALTGQKEIDRRKKKELMLLQLNKQLQRTVNMIMEDINQFANKLAQSIADNNKNQETISILLDKLKNLVSSGQIVANETKETARLAILQKVPRTLNVDRLAIITEEPTKKKYYNLIIHCYQKEKDSSGNIVMCIRKDLSEEQLDTLVRLLEGLEYFSTANLAKQGFNTAKENVTSFAKGLFK